MNLYFKPAVILGALIGVIIGILMLIPFINYTTCFMYGIISVAVIVYLKYYDYLGEISLNDGAIIGAISGFVGTATALTVSTPIAVILCSIFKNYMVLGVNLNSSYIVSGFSIMVWIMLVGFIALLFALFNAFTGLITAYIYQNISQDKDKEKIEFKIDQ